MDLEQLLEENFYLSFLIFSKNDSIALAARIAALVLLFE